MLVKRKISAHKTYSFGRADVIGASVSWTHRAVMTSGLLRGGFCRNDLILSGRYSYLRLHNALTFQLTSKGVRYEPKENPI